MKTLILFLGLILFACNYTPSDPPTFKISKSVNSFDTSYNIEKIAWNLDMYDLGSDYYYSIIGTFKTFKEADSVMNILLKEHELKLKLKYKRI